MRGCRGLGVFIAEQFCPCPTPRGGVGGPPGVNGSNVVARFEQMGGSAELVGEFGLLGV